MSLKLIKRNLLTYLLIPLFQNTKMAMAVSWICRNKATAVFGIYFQLEQKINAKLHRKDRKKLGKSRVCEDVSFFVTL